MDLRIADRARNVTIVPTKTPDPDNLAAAMRHLAAGQLVHTGQVEFEVDAPFMAALIAQKPDGLVLEPEITTLHGKRSASLDGVPIVMVEHLP